MDKSEELQKNRKTEKQKYIKTEIQYRMRGCHSEQRYARSEESRTQILQSRLLFFHVECGTAG